MENFVHKHLPPSNYAGPANPILLGGKRTGTSAEAHYVVVRRLLVLSPLVNMYNVGESRHQEMFVNANIGDTMLVRTPADLGAVVRERRKQLKLNQAVFAEQVGVSRQWIIELEHGHTRAELGLVLRALDALNVHLDAGVDQTGHQMSGAVDIDAIVENAKRIRS
jgi:HTH-type transcriptional regulator / antitoxin HipB